MSMPSSAFTNPLVKPPSCIAVAGDWHGDLRWAIQGVKWAADRGAKVIVHCGDFGYLFRPHFLVRLNEALMVLGIHLMFVEGNHEDHVWLNRQPIGRPGLRQLTDFIWHLPRGFRWRWAGIQFLALGGAHSVDAGWRRKGGQLWQPEERITAEQAALVRAGGPVDVLVSHDCPAGVDIPDLHPEDFEPIELRHAADHRELLRTVADAVQPRHIWHGHYHVRYNAIAQLGYGPVQVLGLAENGSSLEANMQLIDLADLAEPGASR